MTEIELPEELRQLGARTPDEVRDSLLRNVVNGYLDAGRPAPDVAPGSFEFVHASALAPQLCLLEANALIRSEQLFADGAVGAQLESRAAVNNVFRRPKSGSIGPVVLNATAPSPVALGAQLTSTTGLRFRVTAGGLYQPGDSIEVAAIDTGIATNLPEGTVLQWVAAPPYADTKAAVGPGGLVNGTEDETDEELRARYLAKLRNVPAESNHQSIVERAEAASPAVQKAFVYMALRGPSTYALAVAASPTSTNKGRQLPQTTIANVVAPRVVGTHFDAVFGTVQSVKDEPVDVAIALSLPASPSAPVAGAGGGWVNAEPWPPPEAPNNRAVVGAVTSASQFVVQVTKSPTINATRVSWISPLDWRLHTATVIDAELDGPHWRVRLDKPLPGITTGCLVWPECENQAAYVAALLEAFALMGPGEMTDSLAALRRSARFPPPSQAWPYALDYSQLRRISDAGDEVLAARYLHRSAITPNPATGHPQQFVPRHLAFYPNPD